MTIEAVVKFFEATAEHESLRKELAGIIGVGDGNISRAEEMDHDEVEALLGGRGVLVTTFADQRGFAFTVAELNTVAGVFQRFNAGEYSKAELASALGLKEDASPTDVLGKGVGIVYRGIPYKPTRVSSRGMAVLEFLKKTATDDHLRDELAALISVGDGDISSVDELDANELQVLKSERGALVAELAAKYGFDFTMSDLLAVIDLFQRVQAGELGADEYEKFLRLNVNSRDFFPFIEKVRDVTFKGFKHTNAVASVASDNTLQVVRFMTKTGSDEVLRAKLQEIIGGDGDISKPAQLDDQESRALSGERCSQIVDLGAAYGFRFTVSDLNVAAGAFRLVNAGELSEDSCARILGLNRVTVSDKGDLSGIGKTAGMIYRGIRY